MNYFDFYDIPASFFIDEHQLKNAYYNRMRALHPDMHMQASDAEKEALLQQSSLNNLAFNTLKDFNSRLQYILEIYGENKDQKKELPPSFLMEMMDVNEEVMELQFDYSEEKASQILAEIIDQQEKGYQQLRSELEGSKLVKPLDASIETKIQSYLMKKNYLHRIIENIEKL